MAAKCYCAGYAIKRLIKLTTNMRSRRAAVRYIRLLTICLYKVTYTLAPFSCLPIFCYGTMGLQTVSNRFKTLAAYFL